MRVLEPDQIVGLTVRVVPSDAVKRAPEHRRDFTGLVVARVQEDKHAPPQWVTLPVDAEDEQLAYFATPGEIFVST
jgi:hypothetical protein